MTETIESAPDLDTLEVPTDLTSPAMPSTPLRDVQLRGLPLLDLVISQIELTPETWNQNVWRCETGMCVAGWAATLAGGQWLVPDLKADPDGDHLDLYLIAEADDPAWAVSRVEYKGSSVAVVAAEDRARRLLELQGDQTWLFHGDNRMPQIHDWRNRIASDRA